MTPTHLFLDRQGKPSMMRLALFIWAIGGFLIWAIVSLSRSEIQDFPESIAAIIATLAGSKAAQTFAERT